MTGRESELFSAWDSIAVKNTHTRRARASTHTK